MSGSRDDSLTAIRSRDRKWAPRFWKSNGVCAARAARDRHILLVALDLLERDGGTVEDALALALLQCRNEAIAGRDEYRRNLKDVP